MQNIHASCIALQNAGILLTGTSGAGKSDLCLRFIQQKQAVLIADDRVNLEIENGQLRASAPENIFGMLEVRGVGIVPFPAQKSAIIRLVVQLISSSREVERLPEPEFFEFEGCKIPQIRLYAFDISAVEKIIVALEYLNHSKSL